MSVVTRIFLCIGAVFWSLLIHFAPLGGERTIFDWIVLAILPFALVGHVAEMWRAGTPKITDRKSAALAVKGGEFKRLTYRQPH